MPPEQPRNSAFQNPVGHAKAVRPNESEDLVMSYDLIESTLVRLGEEMCERL